MTSPRIIFLGTPEFAVAPLKHLIDKGFYVAGVVTAPDKPAGRGQKLTPSPVKLFALENNIPVFQPFKLKDEDFLQSIRELKPDIQAVVAFRMMPRELWSIPLLGTFNLHASLLPQYRGAAPINWAIINGETETGLTTFFIDDKIDTGEIIFREKMNIGENETAGELHDRMMGTGSELLLKTVQSIADGSVKTQPQTVLESAGSALKPAPKIFRGDCRIDWNTEGMNIHNLIRGLSPYPAAFSYLKKEGEEEILVKIFNAKYLKDLHHELPGKIISDGKGFLRVAVSDGFIDISELQLQGKKRMLVHDFLIGFKGITNWNFQ